MSAKSASSPNFSVRPSKELLPKLQQLATETGRSEAQLMLESTTSIIEMIDEGYDFVPPIVQRARLWREHLARNGGRLLGGNAQTLDDQKRILPSESVRNLSPELIFLPVYSQYEPGLPEVDDHQFRDGMFFSPPCEKVGVPFIKANGATFGIKLDVSEDTAILGISEGMRSGDILLVARPNTLQAMQFRRNPDANPKLGEMDYVTKKRPNFIGIHKGMIFMGRVTAGAATKSWPDAYVYVPAGIRNPDSMRFRIEDCKDVAVITQELLVRGSSGTDF